MKKTLKCVLVLTLVVLALFAITVLGASAATYTTDADAITAGDVVKVEYTKSGAATTEYYASINAAVTGMGDAIADGATITVLGDIAADGAATISQGTVTINGGDFTATGLALTISGGTVTIDGLNITNTTAGVNAITVIGNAVISISDATIQGANAAIWVKTSAVTTPVEISNSTLKAVVQNASTDYGFAFMAEKNCGLIATDVKFVQEFASGITGCKGTGVIRNDARCVVDGSTSYAWVLDGCTVTTTNTAKFLFAVNKDLTLSTGAKGLTLTSANADIFYVASGATLRLSGVAPTETTEAVYLTLNHTANAYKSPINLQGTAKAILNYVSATGATRVFYSAGNSTITANNSKLTVGNSGSQGHNGIVYYEGTVTGATATFTDCVLTARQYAFECASANVVTTLNFNNTTVTYSGSQMFRFNGNGSNVTLNGGVFNGAAGGLILSHANTVFTLNNVTHNAGTYGALRVAGANCTVVFNGGSHTSSKTTWPLFDIRTASTVSIYGGYFECKDDVMFNVGGTATLNIYGGYFHRVSAESENSTFVSAGSSYGSGTANIYGGTFVADYTDVGSVFSINDANSVLNAAAYNGMGSAVIILNEGIVDTEQEASCTFNYNTIYAYGSASLRINKEGDIGLSGLRFTSYVSEGFLSLVSSLADDSTAISYGTVVIPVKYLEDVNYFSVESLSNALVIPATDAGMREDENGGIFIRASIYNLPRASEDEDNTTELTYNDEYAFIVYADYTKNGKTVRHYSNYDENKQTANAAALAKVAAEDLKTEEEGGNSGIYIYPVVGDTLYFSKYSDEERVVINAYAADYADTVKLNGKIYGSLEKALAKAGEGDTIYLLKDITLDASIEIAQNVVIDGQGFTLTMPAEANAHVFSIAADANLTVSNLNVVNEGTSTWSNSIFTFTGVATLTVNGGEYSAAGVVLYGESCGASTVTLNDTTFETRTGTQGNAAPILVNAAMTLNINGGTYTTHAKSATGNALRIINASATVTIDGGTFDAAGRRSAIYVKETTKEVLIGEETAICNNYTTHDIEYYGSYQAFNVNGKLYNSWNDALSAVEAGGTITLVKSLDGNTNVAINKDVTIEGRGYTYTVTTNVHAFSLGTATVVINELNVTNNGNSTYNAAIFVPTGTANLTVNWGRYEAVGVVLYGEGGSASVYTLNNVNFTTRGSTSGSAAPVLLNTENQTLTINNGSFKASNVTTGNCIRVLKACTVDINYASCDANGGKHAIYFGAGTAETNSVDEATVASCTNYTTAAVYGNHTVTLPEFASAFDASGNELGTYSSLEDAIAALPASGGTLKLLVDLSSPLVINTTKSFTLDGDYHEITTDATAAVVISAAANVTIKNLNATVTNENGATVDNTMAPILITESAAGATVTVESGTFTAVSAAAPCIRVEAAANAVLNVNGGTFVGGGYSKGAYIVYTDLVDGASVATLNLASANMVYSGGMLVNTTVIEENEAVNDQIVNNVTDATSNSTTTKAEVEDYLTTNHSWKSLALSNLKIHNFASGVTTHSQYYVNYDRIYVTTYTDPITGTTYDLRETPLTIKTGSTTTYLGVTYDIYYKFDGNVTTWSSGYSYDRTAKTATRTMPLELYVSQGGTASSKYYYTALWRHDEAPTMIAKIDLTTGEILSLTEPLLLGHANDMVYVPATAANGLTNDRLIVVNNAPTAYRLSIFNVDANGELTYYGHKDLNYGSNFSSLQPSNTVVAGTRPCVNGIAYNESLNRYVFELSSGYDDRAFIITDGSFNVIQVFDGVDCLWYTKQGMTADSNYIYVLEHNKGSMMVYDWSGVFQGYINIPESFSGFNFSLVDGSYEPESIQIIGNKLYMIVLISEAEAGSTRYARQCLMTFTLS